MKLPVYFLCYQEFDVYYTSLWSKTHDIYCTFPLHILKHQQFHISKISNFIWLSVDKKRNRNKICNLHRQTYNAQLQDTSVWKINKWCTYKAPNRLAVCGNTTITNDTLTRPEKACANTHNTLTRPKHRPLVCGNTNTI